MDDPNSREMRGALGKPVVGEICKAFADATSTYRVRVRQFGAPRRS